MDYEEMSWEDRVDWSAGYVLKQLLAGQFRSGVWMVLDMATRFPISERKKPKEACRGR